MFEFDYLTVTRKSAVPKNFLWVFKFLFLYACMRVFKLNFAYELAKFGKRNIVLIILFMWWLNLMRNLLICGLNVANFTFCLPEFAPPFFLPTLTRVIYWNLTKQMPSNKVNLNFLWVCKFMVRVRVPWAKFHLIGCWTWREKYSFNKCPLQIFWLLLFYLELNLARNFFVYSLNL